jgi:gliding motility-associated-like protein
LGNVYITSDFENSITFGRYTLHSSQYYSVYLVKYSPQGLVLWARQSVNTNYNIFRSGYSLGYGYSVIADRAGNAYITGTFQDTVTFGSYTLSSPGGYSVFFTKYDSNGNVIWTEQSSPGWSGTGLAVDDSNRIYLSGQIIYYYLNSDELSFGGLKLDVNSVNNTASFIIKFNTDGNPYCGSILNDVGENGELTGVASDVTGKYIYMGGVSDNKQIICGPDTLVSQGGKASMLLARWESCEDASPILPPAPPAPLPVKQNEPCNLFIPTAFSPNQNVNNILYVRSDCITSMKFQVFDRWGNTIFESQDINQGWNGTSNGQPMSVGTYIYYVKATLPDGTNIEKTGNVTLVR